MRKAIKYFLIYSIISLGILSVTRNSSAADPVIYPVKATTGVTVAYVVWSTDVASTSRVDYGTNTAYGSNVTDDSLVTWHKLTITGLDPNTTYHYKVTSGATVSADYNLTTYDNPTGTVKTVGASGKNYTTIQQCANASSYGWTCLVYSGSYGKVTSASSGVTFLAQEDATVASFVLNGRSYNQVKGFNIYNTTTNGVDAGSANNALIENNYIEARGGRGIKIDYYAPANDVVIRKNIIYHSGWTTGGYDASHGIYIFGNRNLIDNNDISHGADFIYTGGGATGGGTNNVIRNNMLHHASHEEIGGPQHIDGSQISGATWNYSLWEGNKEYICTDSTGNCHFFIVRNQTAPAADTIIMRYNFAYKIDSGGVLFGGRNDNVPNAHFYNNIIATEQRAEANGMCVVFNNAPYGVALNNICYNTTYGSPSWSPFYSTTHDLTANGNIAYMTGYDGSWGSPYDEEATYLSLKNLNPQFINYPYDVNIQPLSPARDAGVPLTTVAPGDSGSGTSLVVSDARFFQPGWAGTEADWIAVGTVSNVEQISSIDYGTNTITLANDISRSDGQPVWLYKKSDGVQVLYGTAPDIGANEYVTGEYVPGSVPNPPTNLRSVIN